MSTYRLYLLDARGQIAWGEWFEAQDDGAAEDVAKARCKPGVPSVEVWKGAARLYAFRCPEYETSPNR